MIIADMIITYNGLYELIDLVMLVSNDITRLPPYTLSLYSTYISIISSSRQRAQWAQLGNHPIILPITRQSKTGLF